MRRVWLKGEALEVALKLGFRIEVGDELVLKDCKPLNLEYRGFRTTVTGIVGDKIHIVPNEDSHGKPPWSCWVVEDWIAAVRKKRSQKEVKHG